MRRRSGTATQPTAPPHAAITRPPTEPHAARDAAELAGRLARGTEQTSASLAEDVDLLLPAGFVLVESAVERGDRHAAGRRAAQHALGVIAPGTSLAYDGTRPIVVRAVDVIDDLPLSISITHTRRRAFAIAARVGRLGIDLVDDVDQDRLARMADRYLGRELALATTPRALAACFAAKEAGLKALGLGLLDGGMFEDCAVHVIALDPPQLAARDVGELALVLGRTEDGTLAVAYR